jgi:membrane-associated phospholipid phosphatase
VSSFISRAKAPLRASEWLLMGYFAYVAMVAAWFFPPGRAWLVAALVAAAVLVARLQPIVRDLLPAALTLVAYREMNWFTPAVYDHRLENAWIVWDRRLLDDFGLRAAIESLGPVLPFVLELSYLLVYTVGPLAIAIVILCKSRARVDRFWVAYLIGALGSYALFPYFPSEPPRTAFPGADLPHVVTAVRQFNLWIVGGYGIHSSVFPSAHVACALGAAWGLLAAIPMRRWIGWTMAAYGLTVATATVYGRYHYAVDGAAGIAVSLVGAIAVAALVRRAE